MAAEPHLATWREHNDLHAGAIGEFFQKANVPNRLESSLSITRWAYRQTAVVNGLVWVEGEVLRHLGGE
ncbi:MAG: hypothetical protein NTU53_19040 [Planctomycetota bacterium]|nr:hypothetical protein [Planctomycetota bacterium]